MHSTVYLAETTAAELIAAVGSFIVAITGLAVFIHRVGKRSAAQAIDGVKEMQRRLDPLWTFIDNLPIPAWQKDCGSRMLWINAQYSVQWNINPRRYEGQLDGVIWPADVAAQFVAHDRRVISERIVLETTENIPDVAGDPSSPRRVWRIWKFPIIRATKDGDIVDGVGGFAAPLSLKLEGFRHSEKPPPSGDATRDQISKWGWKQFRTSDMESFGAVVATIIGVGLVRE